jgi:hypothetical protein
MGSSGGGGGRAGRGGGGGGADAFNPTESIYTGAINDSLKRVKSGELNREESIRQYNSDLRKGQAKLKAIKDGDPNAKFSRSYEQNRINALKYAIRETKKL